MLITSLLPDEYGKTPVGNSVEKHLGYPQGKRGENFFHKGMGVIPMFCHRLSTGFNTAGCGFFRALLPALLVDFGLLASDLK